MRALQALCMPDPAAKVALATALQAQVQDCVVAPITPVPPADLPGRPARPELVHPARVPRRSPTKPDGLAALLHAIAHIEFNAINLALDAAWRFDGMPREFHLDWVRVAAEEACHFTLLADDVVARMALVPRTLEARGLDATPQIQQKLRQVGSVQALRSVEILDIILRDEVGHVAIGNHWYRWLCARDGLDPITHYPVLVERYQAPKLYPPFNEQARLRAGFSQEELARLRG